MIQEYADAVPDDFKVSVLAVHSFTYYPTCAKCGLTLGAHPWGLRRILMAKDKGAHNYFYCRGDLNSTSKAIGMQFGAEGPQIVAQDFPVACFGIIHEHIHLNCTRCGFNWLMAVKG